MTEDKNVPGKTPKTGPETPILITEAGPWSGWPGTAVIRAALRGLGAVVRVEDGSRVKGVLATAAPWVVWDGSVAGCSRCKAIEANPPPIALDPEKVNLMPTGGEVFALRILAELLHPFLRKHRTCGTMGVQ